MWRKKLLFIFAIFIFVTFYASVKSNTVTFFLDMFRLLGSLKILPAPSMTILYALAEIYETTVYRGDRARWSSVLEELQEQLWWPGPLAEDFHTFPVSTCLTSITTFGCGQCYKFEPRFCHSASRSDLTLVSPLFYEGSAQLAGLLREPTCCMPGSGVW